MADEPKQGGLKELLAKQRASVAADAAGEGLSAPVAPEPRPERPSKTSDQRPERAARRPRPTPKPSAPADPAVPKWKTMERKEVLCRADQVDALTGLTRRLNRQRGKGNGERLTENTLIRVAMDLLLMQQDKLHGTTEEDLLKSVTPRVRKSGG